MPRQHPLPETGRQPLHLPLDPLRHILPRTVRHMTVRPRRMPALRRPRCIEDTRLRQQHKRPLRDPTPRAVNASEAAISSKSPPICTVPARRQPSANQGIGSASAQSILNTPIPYRYRSSCHRYNEDQRCPPSCNTCRGVISSSTHSRRGQLRHRPDIYPRLDPAPQRQEITRQRIRDRHRPPPRYRPPLRMTHRQEDQRDRRRRPVRQRLHPMRRHPRKQRPGLAGPKPPAQPRRAR